MARAWRRGAGPLLIAFLVLDLAIFVYTETAGAKLNSHIDLTAQQVAWTVLDIFLVWRVWRGGRISWGILLVINIFVLAAMLFGAQFLTAYATVLGALVVAQTAILVAPAVRHRVSLSQQP